MEIKWAGIVDDAVPGEMKAVDGGRVLGSIWSNPGVISNLACPWDKSFITEADGYCLLQWKLKGEKIKTSASNNWWEVNLNAHRPQWTLFDRHCYEIVSKCACYCYTRDSVYLFIVKWVQGTRTKTYRGLLQQGKGFLIYNAAENLLNYVYSSSSQSMFHEEHLVLPWDFILLLNLHLSELFKDDLVCGVRCPLTWAECTGNGQSSHRNLDLE